MARLGTIDCERIMKRTRLSTLAAKVLRERFPDAPDPVKIWLPSKPRWERLLPDLDIFRSELEGVKKRGGKIVLYGHDDMDGVTGIFIGLRVLRNENFHVVPIIPRRDIETYGIGPGGFRGSWSRRTFFLRWITAAVQLKGLNGPVTTVPGW